MGFWRGVCNFYKVVREDFADKVTFEHIPERGKEINLGYI